MPLPIAPPGGQWKKNSQPAGALGTLNYSYTDRTPPASFLFSLTQRKAPCISCQESLPAGDFLFYSASSRAKLTKQLCLWSSNTVPISDRSTRRPGPLLHSLAELFLFSLLTIQAVTQDSQCGEHTASTVSFSVTS